MVARVTLSEAEKARIVSAVRQAESRSGGQILVSIAPRSTEPAHASLAVSCALAFAAAALLWWLRPATSVPMLGLVQCVVLAGCEWLLHASGLGLRLTPASMRHRAVARRAREQFLFEGVHSTEARNGILIFVSRREKAAELVVDRGIEAKEPEELWHAIARGLSAALRKGDLVGGLCEAVEQCGTSLARHYPATQAGANSLADEVREVV